ncbi:MAG: hypothetical protein R2911_38125 [Caldilineaceae bacterium]
MVAAQSGDRTAFGQLVRRFQDMAVGYAYSILQDWQSAEEAAREALSAHGAEIIDIFQACALGDMARVTQMLDADPSYCTSTKTYARARRCIWLPTRGRSRLRDC